MTTPAATPPPLTSLPVAAGPTCPHCGAAVAYGQEFCGACGMALPAARPTGPRLVTPLSTARTGVGRQLHGDELLSTARRAGRSLRSVGIVNLIFAALNLQMMSSNPVLAHSTYFRGITASMGVAGAVYIGLYFLANYAPLVATITGLTVYILKWGVDWTLRAEYGRGLGSEDTVYFFFRLLMIVYLVNGIRAAVRHRKLERDEAMGTAPVPVAVMVEPPPLPPRANG